ncbi:MAG: endo-1,4-beta-xylanase [Treponema sp.]|nr:endo-1,4-beta-xylanase [Treponema sp.]
MKNTLLLLGFILVLIGCPGNEHDADLDRLLSIAESYINNDYYRMQVTNGQWPVNEDYPWVFTWEMAAFTAAINRAREPGSSVPELRQAMDDFTNAIKASGRNPYFRGNPGYAPPFLLRSYIPVTAEAADNWEWHYRGGDTRIYGGDMEPPYFGSTFEVIPNPFNYPAVERAENLIKLTINFPGGEEGAAGSWNGAALRMQLSDPVDIRGKTIFVDYYYPFASGGQFMRAAFWNEDSGGRSGGDSTRRPTWFLRPGPGAGMDAINNLNPDWITDYQGDSWGFGRRQLLHSITSDEENTWFDIILDIHTEPGAFADGNVIYIGNVRIMELDPIPMPIPLVETDYMAPAAELPPLKSIYNNGNGMFLVGSTGTGTPTGTRHRHYDIFVSGGNLKAAFTTPRTPFFLRELYPDALWAETAPDSLYSNQGDNPVHALPGFWGGPDGTIPPTALQYQQHRDALNEIDGVLFNNGNFYSHGHVLAWYNQAPPWMRQLVPANIEFGWRPDGAFYNYGNGTPPFHNDTLYRLIEVPKEVVRRVQFNHITGVMRHFYSTSQRYGSSPGRGIIPFHSWDVLNEEIHESRHNSQITQNPNSWRASLKSTNWLSAMSGEDLLSDDAATHYIYLLFKYAHIAVPNARMAENWDREFAAGRIPAYLLLDGHHNERGIGDFVQEKPPLLVYNEYDIHVYSKARTAYNMLRELNKRWMDDPWYDGRPLIEIMGIQGHDSAGSVLASNNQAAIAMYASLVHEGLLSGICFSELDFKLSADIPGGAAVAPSALNHKQNDVLGYQFALAYRTFAKWAGYITHIINWGWAGTGWQGGFVLFQGGEENRANGGFYGAVNPGMFVAGHPYLDSFFTGEDGIREWDKVNTDYMPNLGPAFPGPNPPISRE